MKSPREIIETSGCVLGFGLKDRGRRQAADGIIYDLYEAGYVIVPWEPSMEVIYEGNTEINNCIDAWNYDSGSGYSVEPHAALQTWQAMINKFYDKIYGESGETIDKEKKDVQHQS